MGFYPTPVNWFREGPISPLVVVGNQVSVDLSPLNGDAHRRYRVDYRIINAQAPTPRDFRVYPNAVQGVSPGLFNFSVGGGVPGNFTRGDFCVAIGTAREVISGWFEIDCEENPLGTSVTFPRRMDVSSNLGDDPPAVGTSGVFEGTSFWTDLATNLTSIRVICTENGNPALTFAGIGDGSWFRTSRLG